MRVPPLMSRAQSPATALAAVLASRPNRLGVIARDAFDRDMQDKVAQVRCAVYDADARLAAKEWLIMRSTVCVGYLAHRLVATKLKCHGVCKAEVSPTAPTVAKPDRAETSHIAALAGFAGST